MSQPAIESSYALTPLQQGLLFDGRFLPEVGIDTIQVVCESTGPLGPDALAAAWDRAAGRHAALRTSFTWPAAGRPEQHVHRSVRLPWTHEDLSTLDPATRGRRLDEHLRQDALTPFDLGRAPLVRLALLRTGAGAHRLVLTFHHSVLDGRSLRLLLEEVFAGAEAGAGAAGTSPPADSAPAYGDYVDAQARIDRSGDERFWRDLLAGFTGPSPLPADRPVGPPPADPGTHLEHRVELSAGCSHVLRRLASAHGLTLNTLVQGAWALLLAAHGGRSDVVFGAVRSLRRGVLPDADRVVGLCLNNLPVRAIVSPSDRLLPWLGELRRQSVAVRDHQHAALSDVHRWAGVPAGGRLFDSFVVFENHLLDRELRRLGGTWASRSVSLRRRLAHPLVLSAFAEERLLLTLLHDPRRLPEAAVARLGGHLRTLLEGMAVNPERRLGELPLAGEDERFRLLVGLNATKRERPRGVCVHELVERRAAEAPDAPAVTDPAETVSYGELNARANRLARLLRARGVGPETVVCVQAERSVALVAAELAVLKAGGAYLPADPTWPTSRLRRAMRDAGAALLLQAGRPGDGAAGTPHLDLAEASRLAATNPADDLPRSSAPANLAYLVCTSGSTGQPKSVQCTHDGLVNTAAWLTADHGVGPGDRVAHLCNAAFDVAVLETWGALAAGASLHLPDEDTRLTPALLAEWLRAQGITVALMSTGIAEAVLRLPWPAAPAPRVLMAMGDRLHAVDRAGLPFAVVNAYGPAEAAVLTTAGRVATGPAGERQPSIGRPLPNVRTYVLDASLRAVAGGVTGELCIGGDGLARGYAGRPDLTAERFVPDPFAPRPGARMYRSGDAARHRPSGDLEFIGRLDRQVKVRGLRVEPAEVEAALRRHPAVAEAVVVAAGTTAADRRLVAHVVGDGGPPPGGGELRAFLRDRLPDFMVPALYVALGELPLTRNGKVDRDALPAPDPAALRDGAAPAPAGTALEATLLGVWLEALGLAGGPGGGIGVHDDFFELGGHSLLAAATVMRLNELLGTELTVRDLFRAPTVAGLASRIEAADASPPRAPVLAIPRLDRAGHRRLA